VPDIDMTTPPLARMGRTAQHPSIHLPTTAIGDSIDCSVASEIRRTVA
jgi:hypothetical protein